MHEFLADHDALLAQIVLMSDKGLVAALREEPGELLFESHRT